MHVRTLLTPLGVSASLLASTHHAAHLLNGLKIIEVMDNDPKHRALEGILALQIDAGVPRVVEFKDVLLRNP